MALRRYWLTFDVTFDSPYLMLLQGCGVTAYSLEDAHELIQTYILAACRRGGQAKAMEW